MPIASAPISGTSQALEARDCVYWGCSLRETGAASTVTIRIRAGGVVTGDILDTIQLNPSESTRDWYGPMGIRAEAGIYVQVTGSGTVEGAVRYL